MEAHFTGNNAAAGALGALTAEAAAPLIMQTLYGTEKPENLTDSQKQNVANLSQIAAGLSGGLVGDSTVSGIAGAEIGKRAVENNYLYRQEAEELLNLRLALQLTTNAEEKEKIQIRINELEKLDQDRQEHIKTVCPDFGKSSSACSAAIADAEKAKTSYNGWTDQYQPVGYNSKDKRPYTTIFTQDYGRVNEALVGKDELTRQKEELMGFNDTTGGNCIFCYSHSSYFAELPERFLKNDKGQYIDLKGNVVAKNNKIENEYLKEFDKIWSYENNNLSLPILVMPKDKGEEK